VLETVHLAVVAAHPRVRRAQPVARKCRTMSPSGSRTHTSGIGAREVLLPTRLAEQAFRG
jgi:hypothetical protein